MLWQKEVQIDKLIGPSHSSESKLGRQSPCRFGRWSLPSASLFPRTSLVLAARLGWGLAWSLLLTLCYQLQHVPGNASWIVYTKHTYLWTRMLVAVFLFVFFLKDSKALLLLASVAVRMSWWVASSFLKEAPRTHPGWGPCRSERQALCFECQHMLLLAECIITQDRGRCAWCVCVEIESCLKEQAGSTGGRGAVVGSMGRKGDKFWKNVLPGDGGYKEGRHLKEMRERTL